MRVYLDNAATTPGASEVIAVMIPILKNDFGLLNGLADTSKDSEGLHKVQILDPAVGTGTFISKIIRHIYESLKNINFYFCKF